MDADSREVTNEAKVVQAADGSVKTAGTSPDNCPFDHDLTFKVPRAGRYKSNDADTGHVITSELVGRFAQIVKRRQRVKIFRDNVGDRLLGVDEIDLVVNALRTALNQLDARVTAGVREFYVKLLIDVTASHRERCVSPAFYGFFGAKFSKTLFQLQKEMHFVLPSGTIRALHSLPDRPEHLRF